MMQLRPHLLIYSLAVFALLAKTPPAGAQEADLAVAEPHTEDVATAANLTASGEPEARDTPAFTTPAPKASARDAIRAEIAELALQRDLLSARALVAKERLAAELRERREALDREKLEMDERNQSLQRESLGRKVEMERELEQLRTKTERWKIESAAVSAQVDARLNGLRLKETELKGKLSHLSLEVSAKEREIQARLYSQDGPTYLDDPLQGKTLVISDRRIALNGPISSRTATYISTRIDYFNNRDADKPIFIVIDDSPGGSVMAGYHILKAMEGSKAPVYVVVKQFAASMAACITTLADRSFAYPNAVLLHHQISGGLRGNLTQQRESLEDIEEWWRRLAAPVAAKMGITADEFIDQMYKRVSTGDWTEFADEAAKLKWVDHVIDEIRETGQEKHPDARPPSLLKPTTLSPTRSLQTESAPAATGARLENGLIEYVDHEGQPYVLLPRPNPIDKFYMHNPDGYYRFR